PGALSSDFTANISWGDGSVSSGTISGSGPFTISGSHSYGEGGSYAMYVTVNDRGGSALTMFLTPNIADYRLSATGVTAKASKNFSGTVAKLTDTDPTATSAEYLVTIAWGDGTSSSGTVGGKKSPFTIQGNHTYGSSGNYKVTVTVQDTGGATATATSALTVH
ncbi:MAG TPA: hypothetical protein VIJ91_13825, partial [Candidatus Dormibacteraeota bacterium]